MSGSSQQYVIDTLSAQESWRLFRIMAEMVEGIDTLSALPPCVSIFGSARSRPEDALYRQTEEIARGLVEAGYGVITGGGPGLMEAGNRGATEAGGPSVGLHIQLPMEQAANQYLQTRFRLAFGNRIIKQMYDFIPVYVACGGTELGGMDYIIARKVLKKFESMNVSFVRDEMTGLIEYIEKTFGEGGLPDSVSYLLRIQNMY